MGIRRSEVPCEAGAVEREGASIQIRRGLRTFVNTVDGGICLNKAIKTLESGVTDGTIKVVGDDDLSDIVYARRVMNDKDDKDVGFFEQHSVANLLSKVAAR